MASKKRKAQPPQPLQKQEPRAEVAKQEHGDPSPVQQSRQHKVTFTEKYTGFIPPQVFVLFERTELGRQYLQEIIEQSQHRRYLEKLTIEKDNDRADRGLTSANCIAYTFLAAGFVLTVLGHEWVGGATIISSISSLVGTFIYGTKSRRNERSERFKQLSGSQDDTEVESEEQNPKLPGM